ncbi:MAG: acetyl/propionyl/methylcrotonyl-CoA carboxylase subunit alpha [Alphaproteobacteria bacterium]|nr:acetyl/propionyl/methylcrotonyl-CoA carboxylase subunit alpha [Alphaproteobacteria bacterium]
MLESLLIANRGEIARRIIRTAKKLGVRTIAVHSEADTGMPFVREADMAECIGPAPARESYLDGAKILAAAKKMGARAIHPGYGFLSENADFAEAVERAGLIWVGAPPSAIRAMGLKDAAKKLMQDAGVPVTPGYLGEDQAPEHLKAQAGRIGYPVLIKAVAGGGGKGMRRVDAADGFADALASCKREAASAFGDDRVLIEKYITAPRHIEVQIFGDRHGNMVHLFERDCSMQRRHQKVVEEAPAPGMDEAIRAALTGAAVTAARAVGYVGAGTIEFIADASEGLRADWIWFMEMNTRLQVEHPVTEAITGEDLVEWQLRVASGEKLPKTQEQLSITGWAMEARLYAENPPAGFLPSTGRLAHLRLPPDIRVDSAVEEGDPVTPYYDPMIAKLIVHGATRAQAAADLAAACRTVEVWPVKTNAGFLARATTHPDFVRGGIDTGFIERHAAEIVPPAEPDTMALAAAAAALLPTNKSDPWTALTGFRSNAAPDNHVAVEIHGKTHLARPVPGGTARDIGGERVLFLAGDAWAFSVPLPRSSGEDEAGDGAVLAPMPGALVQVAAAKGSPVKRGERLLVLEAMKMEYVLVAPFDGKVVELTVSAGAQVEEGALLARIEKAN